ATAERAARQVPGTGGRQSWQADQRRRDRADQRGRWADRPGSREWSADGGSGQYAEDEHRQSDPAAGEPGGATGRTSTRTRRSAAGAERPLSRKPDSSLEGQREPLEHAAPPGLRFRLG